MSGHPTPEQLSAFLDLEADEATRLTVEAHLAACDACAAHLAELAAVDEAARALPLPEPAGYFDDFAARVRARVDVRPARRTLPVWSWAAAAALLLAVITPLALREQASRSPAAVAVRQDAPFPESAAAPAAKPQAPAANDAKPRESEQAQPEERGRGAGASGRGAVLSHGTATAVPEAARELQAVKDEAAQPAPSILSEAATRLEKRDVDGPKALGYDASPATGQRQHGPRSQQFAPPPAAAPARAEEVAVAEGQTVESGAGADLAVERSTDEGSAARAKRSVAGGGAAARLGAAGSELRQEPPPARSAEEARARREAFRKMALERPDEAAADEARVGIVAEGVRAYRLEGRAGDRALAERDGRAYLARPDARQKPRVRALLEELAKPR